MLKVKNLLSIALAVTSFLALATQPYGFRASAVEDYRMWRQFDSRWSDIPIGNTTIGQSGCFVTAISILAVHSGAEDAETFNPGSFAQSLKNLGAFNEYGGLADWGAVTQIIPEVKVLEYSSFKSCTQEGKAEEIRSATADGNYVICDVGGHWVFVEDVQGSDVYMIDPAKDQTLMFDAYANDSILSYEVLSGKNPSYSVNGNNSGQSEEVAGTESASTAEFTTQTTATETALAEQTTETASPATEKKPNVAEFYYAGDEPSDIYSDTGMNGEVIAQLEKGTVVTVQEVENGCGLIFVNGREGWIDMAQMVFAEDFVEIVKGDINLDGIVDLYDLALVNEYIKTARELPDGVSFLSRQELATADMNFDGAVDGKDVAEYLKIISE